MPLLSQRRNLIPPEAEGEGLETGTGLAVPDQDKKFFPGEAVTVAKVFYQGINCRG